MDVPELKTHPSIPSSRDNSSLRKSHLNLEKKRHHAKANKSSKPQPSISSADLVRQISLNLHQKSPKVFWALTYRKIEAKSYVNIHHTADDCAVVDLQHIRKDRDPLAF